MNTQAAFLSAVGIWRPRRDPRRTRVTSRPARVCACASDGFAALARDLRAHLAAERARLDAAAVDTTDTEADNGADLRSAHVILSYAALGQARRGDLVQRMMTHGGFPTVLAALGEEVPLNAEPTKESKRKVLFSPAVPASRLALGAGLEERLSASTSSTNNSARLAARVRVEDDVLSGAQLAAEASVVAKKNTETESASELLTLDGRMRACALVVIGVSALGYGHASVGVIPDNITSVCRIAADILCVTHVALGVCTAILGARKQRSAGVWAVKGVLGGAAALAVLLGEDKAENC